MTAAARRCALLLPLLLLGAVVPAAAQQGEPPVGDSYGWHVVRPGDTLRDITEHYLGDPELWRENWKLNPWIRDPNLLLPGQRLRVIVARRLPPRTAAVTDLAGRVDEKPQPQPWVAAERGDLLRESDGVRTFERSSAELRFDDGAELRLTEGSLVFLRRLGTSLTGETRDTVEIVDGQADLVARRRQSRRDIEIVVGDATARPRGAEAEHRVRRLEGAGQLMVYRGEGDLEAAGVMVRVPEGMGSTVPDGGTPAPPERLPPAPRALEPLSGAELGYANPLFRWRPVAGVTSYVIEVCGDADCGVLVERAVGVEGERWRPDGLPTGELFWRVTAAAASGLDGYPSDTVPFAVRSARRDQEPPVVAFVPRGAVEVEEGGRRVSVGADGALMPALHDDASGVASAEVRWDGGAWEAWDGGLLVPGRGEGETVLEMRVRDGVGRERLERVVVTRDLEPPEAPQVGTGP